MRAIVLSLSTGDARVVERFGLGDDGRLDAAPRTIDLLGTKTIVAMRNAETGEGAWLLDVEADRPWERDVTVEARVELAGAPPSHQLRPLYHGVLERTVCDGTGASEFRGAGRPAGARGDEDRLSLPFLLLDLGGSWLLAGADPAFSSTIAVGPAGDGWAVTFSWVWLAAAGRHAFERRRLFVGSTSDPAAGLDRWFELATPDIPPGPAWLHEIALNDYDFLSEQGTGWFADIDAACELIEPADRGRALFCLHGWYDEVGRYCFDPVRRTLDEEWTAFPHAQDPRLAALEAATPVRKGLPGLANYRFRNFGRAGPVRMGWAGIRRRLEYAKSRGLRTCLYCLTGLQAQGRRDEALESGTGLEIAQGPWVGPDAIGETHVRNPLHPEVRGSILAYVDALLGRVGDLVDALVMDETYYVGVGALGSRACPGYADRAQLALVQELAALCHSYRPDLAFLTADLLGASWLERRAFAYSLGADGIYQDSGCWPETWDCVRFPAWRNVAWSCNWAPVSNFALTRWAVLAHNAPIALSNGCFGDDLGLAEMDAETKAGIAELWRLRRHRRMAPRLVVVHAVSGPVAPSSSG